MRIRPLLSSMLVALLVPLHAQAQAGARARGGGRGGHPQVAAGANTCEECHAQATPGPFRDWRESRHGIDLVKCFVCHGSTGADFRRKPPTDRCAGCHGEQVASMRAPAMKGKDCFSCHAPHALNPHTTSPATTTAAKLGADRLGPMETVEGRIPPPAPPATAAGAPGAAPAASAPAAPAPAPAVAPTAPQAGSAPAAPPPPATPAAPGADKDLTKSQPHPPTDR